MPYASEQDINVHLPGDKLILENEQYVTVQLQAERIVRGLLAGSVPKTMLMSWNDPVSDPGNVPEMIRYITGELAAVFYYRERYSEDSLRDPEYAQVKYDEAMGFLRQIIAGTLELIDAEITTVTGDLASTDFWPNNTTTPPKFRMDLFEA